MGRTIKLVSAALGHAAWWLGYQVEWSRARRLDGASNRNEGRPAARVTADAGEQKK